MRELLRRLMALLQPGQRLPGRSQANAVAFVRNLLLLLAMVPALLFYIDLEGWDMHTRSGHAFLLLLIAAALASLVIVTRAQRSAFPVSLALSTTVAVHGLLGAAMLATRSFYSLRLMAASVIWSSLVCAIAAYRNAKLMNLSVGVVPMASLERLQGYVGASLPVVPSPEAPISDYDLLVVDAQDAAKGPWAAFLSRAYAGRVEIMHWSRYVEERKGRVDIADFDISHLDYTSAQRLYVRAKRMCDLLGVMAIAPLALPALAAGMAAVRFLDGKPIFFTQQRIGAAGVPFTIYKLRTMRNGRTEQDQTSIADARVTSVGGILRKLRIDELPQLLNILRGDMSLVGPRPEQPALAAEYMREIPNYANRHLVRPGVTGWAQVKLGYTSTVEETAVKLSYDLFYVKRLSLDLDIRILVKTIFTILFGRGAR